MCQFWRILQRCKIAATPPLCSAGSLGRRRTGSWVTRLGRARHSSIQRRLADRDSSRGSGHVHRWTMSIALSTTCDLLKQQNVLTVQPHNFHSLCSHVSWTFGSRWLLPRRPTERCWRLLLRPRNIADNRRAGSPVLRNPWGLLSLVTLKSKYQFGIACEIEVFFLRHYSNNVTFDGEQNDKKWKRKGKWK